VRDAESEGVGVRVQGEVLDAGYMMHDAGQSASLTLYPKPCTLICNHEGHEEKIHEDHEERSRNFVLVVSQSCMRD
jgi:hypothetical protein